MINGFAPHHYDSIVLLKLTTEYKSTQSRNFSATAELLVGLSVVYFLKKTIAVSCIISEIKRDIAQKSQFFIFISILRPVREGVHRNIAIPVFLFLVLPSGVIKNDIETANKQAFSEEAARASVR